MSEVVIPSRKWRNSLVEKASVVGSVCIIATASLGDLYGQEVNDKTKTQPPSVEVQEDSILQRQKVESDLSRVVTASGAIADWSTASVPTERFVICPEACPPLSFELEALAVDIARRTVLAFDPKAGKHPIQTLDLKVRSQGEIVHLSAKVLAKTKSGLLLHRAKETTWDVSTSLIYRPELRRIIDLNVRPDGLISYRACPRIPQLITAYNEEFDRQDQMQQPSTKLSHQLDLLTPRTKEWLHSPLRGKHDWHAFQADRYGKQRKIMK